MLSRVADSLFWLGRYAERVETNTHILATHLDYMLEHSQNDGKYKVEWEKIIRICGYIDDFHERYKTFEQCQLIHYLLHDEQNYNAIVELIINIRNNAKNARDIIPNELWEVWNELYLKLPDFNHEEHTVLNTLDQIVPLRRACLTATGVIDSLMTRDEGFQFLKIGKWIERSEKTAFIMFHLIYDNEELIDQTLAYNFGLKLTNAYEEYMKRNRTRDSANVLNFLMGDLKCTRSVAYGIRKIKQTIYDIENGKQQLYATQLFLALEEIEQLVQLDANELTRSERIQWVDTIRTKCTLLGPIFAKTYYLTPPILVDEEAYAK